MTDMTNFDEPLPPDFKRFDPSAEKSGSDAAQGKRNARRVLRSLIFVVAVILAVALMAIALQTAAPGIFVNGI